MKPSLYNHIIRRRGRPQLLFNILSRRLLELSPVQSAMYGGLVVPITRNLMNLRDPAVEQFLQLLVDQGFFITDERQEPLELELASHQFRFDTGRLCLWVQNTTRCEENCPDCPYQPEPKDMGQAALESLEGLVASRAGCLRQLEVVWFGGEPTLNWEPISRLNRSFTAKASSDGFLYKWGIVSNGRSHHLKTIHISTETPAHVWLNLESLDSGEFETHRSILLASLQGIEDLIRRLPPLSRIRLQPNRPSARLCRNLNGLCQRTPNFGDDEWEVVRRLIESGFHVVNLPEPALVPCLAADPQSFIMDVDGNLYKCWNSVGHPQRGLPGIEDLMHYNFIRWLDWNPYRVYHCRNCNILPWCLGGCLDRPGDEDCGQWRYSLREMLKLLVLDNEKRTVA